jgi:hypothetical protein
MSLLVAWVVFPALLTLLATGCGLLLRIACGWEMPGPLVPAAGLALIVVVIGFLTMSGATAELSVPFVLGLAVAGFGLAFATPELVRGWRPAGADWWTLLAALGAFAVFAAPVVLSGKATFAGYIKLDDTATWMAFTDRLMEHGRSTDGLAPSTYEATIAFNLPRGYPVGAFLPLGVGRVLVGQDVAWLVQPYMAVSAAMLAGALSSIARPFLRAPRPRALAAFIAAQPALLFGYSLWGGIKEVSAALMIALLAATAPTARADWARPGRLLIVAVAGAALVGVLGAGGAVWLVTILVPAGLLAAGWALRGIWALLPRGGVLAFMLAVLSIPALFASGTLFSPTQGPLVNERELGNLLNPLDGLQVVGIWPAGDFRLQPDESLITYVLIGVAIVAAVIGLLAALRAREWALPLYSLGTVAGCFAIVVAASPWVDGKALASAAPAVLLAACAGAAFLWRTDARPLGGVALAAIGAAVIWSNVLGYRNVNLAPRDQLAELQDVGSEIAGQGPSLMTESEVYGGRHFLRESDPENSTDLRRSLIPLIDGGEPDELPEVDLDRLALPGLLHFRTLVLRRSPANSRPPSPYELIDSGRFYDVWQRPVGVEGQVLRHLGLGEGLEPAAVPDCGEILDLARLARERGAGARLAAVARPPVTVIGLADSLHPVSWEIPTSPGPLFLTNSGDLRTVFSTARRGRYRLWLGGSVRGTADAQIDGREVGTIDGQLDNAGEYTSLGEMRLARGRHRLLLQYDSKPLSPGTATPPELPYPAGPIVVSAATDDPGVVYVAPARARRLCGKSWDWVEALDK